MIFHKSILSVAIVVTLFSCSKNGKPTSATPGSTSKTSAIHQPKLTTEDSLHAIISGNETAEEIQWLTLQEAELYMTIKPKKVFVDMYTSWCGWCKELDKKTFTNKEVISYMNKHYYAIKFDAESKKSYDFNGKTYTFNGKNNQFAVDMMEGYMSFPTTVYIDSDKSMISHVPGFWKPDDFLLILTFFQEDHYKTMRFEEYKNSKQ